MGRKLDALLGRRFKTSKLKATASLAVHRLAVLKNQRQARCSIARSDVVGLLNSNSHDRALLRVEQVIREKNMLDVFDMLEGYCSLLIERVHLFEQEKCCPEELIEAVSTLIHAATRCGEFPELQELRAIFTSRFGKEFAARAVELRNNCGVNPKIIQKLSTRTPSLENKMKVLKEIASENNIDLQLEETTPDTRAEIKDSGPSSPSGGEINEALMHADHDEVQQGSARRRKYKDVADAAQAAFESAAFAAAAARAAVELSRSESTDPDHPNSREEPETTPRENAALFKRSLSVSSSDSSDDEDGNDDGEQKKAAFDESDDDVDGDHDKAEEMSFGWKMERRDEEVEGLNINRRPISVRTKWAQGG